MTTVAIHVLIVLQLHCCLFISFTVSLDCCEMPHMPTPDPWQSMHCMCQAATAHCFPAGFTPCSSTLSSLPDQWLNTKPSTLSIQSCHTYALHIWCSSTHTDFPDHQTLYAKAIGAARAYCDCRLLDWRHDSSDHQQPSGLHHSPGRCTLLTPLH